MQLKFIYIDYKQKAIQYQEDLDQLEGFQSQEIAKVKHLVTNHLNFFELLHYLKFGTVVGA